MTHATSVEGMKRAIAARVATIEHGNDSTMEIFKMMKENNIAFCATLAASEAIAQYQGWKKNIDSEPELVQIKRKSVANALRAGVTIVWEAM